MLKINKNSSLTELEIEFFLNELDFNVSLDFVSFFKETNGAIINSDTKYIILWALTDMITLNIQYNVNEYAPGFFIFGSDGGDIAYAIEKQTNHIFELPFVGMSKEEAQFICSCFEEFITVYLNE